MRPMVKIAAPCSNVEHNPTDAIEISNSKRQSAQRPLTSRNRCALLCSDTASGCPKLEETEGPEVSVDRERHVPQLDADGHHATEALGFTLIPLQYRWATCEGRSGKHTFFDTIVTVSILPMCAAVFRPGRDLSPISIN